MIKKVEILNLGPLSYQKLNNVVGSKSAGNSPACSPVTDKKFFSPATLTNNVKTRSQSIAVGSSPKTPNPDSPLSSPLKSNPETIISVVGVKDLRCQKGQTPKAKKKEHCPCGKLSAGTEWLLPCSSCKQIWHNSCAGLKGNFTRPVLDSVIKTWHCPWCYVCAFSKPGKHSTSKNSETLSEKVLSSVVFQEIAETVTEAVEKSMKAPDFSTLEKLVEEFTQQLNDFQFPSHDAHVIPSQSPALPLQGVLSSPIPTSEKPFTHHQEGFLSEELAHRTFNFLKECKNAGKFIQENGHSVLAYGESYSYNGSRAQQQNTDIPPQMKNVIDKVVEQLNLDYTPNAVLINHFPATAAEEESFLNHHCDDEPAIVADSCIVTLSFGGQRKITFEPLHDCDAQNLELTPSSNSAYVMTRSSQAWFRHGIPEMTYPVEERFSITLRTINKNFCRSTLVIGDSNTKELVFGTGKGTFGESFPGKRVKASTIQSIDPKICIGYAHIIIACGTNNLRPENIHHKTQINKLVEDLRLKVMQIGKISPKSKITVLPVLPTRLNEMNQNILFFNKCVADMLRHCFNDNVLFPGIYQFLDRSGLLAAKFTRTNDLYHLGDRGIAQLVSIIKQSVYRRECENRAVSNRGQQPARTPT